MRSTAGRLLAIVVILAWIAAVAAWAYGAWPHVSLDLSAGDPATRAAYQAAVNTHILKAALAASIPTLLLGLYLFAIRKR
jgi:hypothetical protein